MAIKTTRTGDDGQNWTQQTIGETPNSVEVSINSKGAAQVAVKLYFASPVDMAHDAARALDAVLTQVHETLAAHGIPLAGMDSREGR